MFELAKHCPFGHAFALIGDAPQLGQWDVSQALKLEVRAEITGGSCGGWKQQVALLGPWGPAAAQLSRVLLHTGTLQEVTRRVSDLHVSRDAHNTPPPVQMHCQHVADPQAHASCNSMKPAVSHNPHMNLAPAAVLCAVV